MTVCETENLYPRMVEKRHPHHRRLRAYGGQRKAVDEYFARNEAFIFLSGIGYSGSVGVKRAIDRVAMHLPSPAAVNSAPE